MKKVVLSCAVTSLLAVNLFSDDISDLKMQIEALTKKVEKLEKKQARTNKSLSKVRAHDANDNIKWSIDFRTAYQYLKYDLKNKHAVSNPSLFTNRLWLGLAASPVDDLVFKGQLAVYSTWGGNNLPVTDPFQNVNWRASSKPDDIVVKLRQAYFTYTFNKSSSHPITISAGRRAASDGFLANHREGNDKPGSPLAHITNMEVDAGMIKIGNAFGLEGSYVKFVGGRSYDNINRPSFYGTPYTDVNAVDSDVNFFVMPMSIYNDGQFNLMAQYTYIFDFMGVNSVTGMPQTGAGDKHMGAVSLEINGLNEDSDFLDDSTLFLSGAFTTSVPKNGFSMLGSNKTETGYSIWAGFIIPDLITDNGHIGFEYNYGTKYWAPMTWAEDTVSGSKIATRGSAYEVYWNLPIVNHHFSTQIRYTYMDYNYKSNIEEFWADPKLQDGDVTSAQDLRIYLRYTY